MLGCKNMFIPDKRYASPVSAKKVAAQVGTSPLIR